MFEATPVRRSHNDADIDDKLDSEHVHHHIRDVDRYVFYDTNNDAHHNDANSDSNIHKNCHHENADVVDIHFAVRYRYEPHSETIDVDDQLDHQRYFDNQRVYHHDFRLFICDEDPHIVDLFDYHHTHVNIG